MMGEPKENIDNIIIGFPDIESSESMLTQQKDYYNVRGRSLPGGLRS